VSDPDKYLLWCWIDAIRDTASCRFTVIDMRVEEPQTVLQEGFNSIEDAVTWGVNRMRKLGIDGTEVYTRVGYLDQDDSEYHFIHDIFDENTALVCKLLLE